MKIDNFGRVIVSEDDAVAALYSGKIKDLSCVFLENTQEVDQFNMSVKSNADNMALLPEYVNDEDLDLFDEANRCSWFMPKHTKLYRWFKCNFSGYHFGLLYY